MDWEACGMGGRGRWARLVIVVARSAGLVGGAARATAADEAAGACFADLRATEDGQRVETFLRAVQRELGAAGWLAGDEAAVLRRLLESDEGAKRDANHARLHLLLAARLDEPTRDAIHDLTRDLLACVAAHA
jgi:hypothetical protein